MTREEILEQVADITWLFDQHYFIGIREGQDNYIWSYPDNDDENSLTRYPGDVDTFCEEYGVDGSTIEFVNTFIVKDFVGTDVIFKEF